MLVGDKRIFLKKPENLEEKTPIKRERKKNEANKKPRKKREKDVFKDDIKLTCIKLESPGKAGIGFKFTIKRDSQGVIQSARKDKVYTF